MKNPDSIQAVVHLLDGDLKEVSYLGYEPRSVVMILVSKKGDWQWQNRDLVSFGVLREVYEPLSIKTFRIDIGTQSLTGQLTSALDVDGLSEPAFQRGSIIVKVEE